MNLKNKLKKHFEVFLIRIAIFILKNRNVPRSPVVSRKDNNAMYGMSAVLECICKRMLDEYNNVGD